MNKENLTTKFTEDIKQKIFSGEYKVGQSIPPLRQLAQEYGFSRSVVNVGIARLETQGYLKVLKRQKITVNDFLSKGSLDVIRDMAFCNNRELKERATYYILSARKLIELESVRCAAEKHNSDEIIKLEKIIAKEQELVVESSENYAEIAEIDYRFHDHIIKLSGNSVYIAVMNVFKSTALKMTKQFYTKNNNVFSYYVEKHKQIAEAIKNHDADKAIKILQEILEHGERAYKNFNL